MSFVVKVICEGAGGYTHKPRTVAQFRDDGGGWARAHNEGEADSILWLPTGELSVRHSLECDRCTYDGYFGPESLYPKLDEARTRGWMSAP